MSRTIIIPDIHGNRIGLDQILTRTKYDQSSDRLITLGDYSDGYPESAEVIELLSSLPSDKNIYLLGNHDLWTIELLSIFRDCILNELEFKVSRSWVDAYYQGGKNTFKSYVHNKFKISFHRHLEFLSSLKWYHIENNIAFVHGGWKYSIFPDIVTQYNVDKTELIWDRSLWSRAQHLQDLLDKGYNVSSDKLNFGEYDKIFIGHTSTSYEYPELTAVQCCNVINLDAGSGSNGRLICYILETGEIITSDLVQDLYKNVIPRNG